MEGILMHEFPSAVDTLLTEKLIFCHRHILSNDDMRVLQRH